MTDQQPPSATGGTSSTAYEFCPSSCTDCGEDAEVWSPDGRHLATIRCTELAALRAERDQFHADAELEVKAWQTRSDEHRARAERAASALREAETVLGPIWRFLDFEYERWPSLCDAIMALRERCEAALAAQPEATPSEVDWKVRAERAEAALREYGFHRGDCGTATVWRDEDGVAISGHCSCGFTEAMAAMAGGKGSHDHR